jgi:uncharacterized damage-inducible protein DinB
MQDTRGRTLDELKDLPAGSIDAPAPVGANTIGTLLYHIAVAEASWLYKRALGTDIPVGLSHLLPLSERDEHGILSALRGDSLESYLTRLAILRERLIEAYKSMTLEEFRRVRDVSGRYDVTPEWILHHLMQHEAEHRGHIHVIVESLR